MNDNFEMCLAATGSSTRQPGTNLSFCVTQSCFYCSNRCFITACVCSFSGVCVSVIVWMTCLLWKSFLVWETTEVLSDYLMYTQRELFEMNHMMDGTRHVHKIKYNYSITQIFWRELNKYPNEEMKPTFFLRFKRMRIEKCPWIRANIWDGKHSNITWPYGQKKKHFRRHRTRSCRKGDARSEVGKNGKISVTFSSSFGNKIKRCRHDKAPALRSISVWHCFMRKAAVVCCWQGTVWKVTSHVFLRTRLSICTPFPFLPERNLCWLVIMWLGETKEWDPNRHSALWRISTARMCCRYVSNPHLRQRRLLPRLSLQLNRLQ